MAERLQKFLAAAGLGSRREIEGWIAAGRLSVDGDVAVLGTKVSGTEKIELDGRRLKLAPRDQKRRVFIYNKPEGVVSTRSDPEGRKTVFDKLPVKKRERWITVGRLDINSTGLMLFTNDGELAHRLMHPSGRVDREYAVRVKGDVDDAMLQRLRDGVLLDDGVASFSDIQPGREATGSNRWFYVVLMEGRNREVRRLWESQDVQVSRLKRVRYGNVFMPSHLKQGHYSELEELDVQNLCKLVGLA
ncbi:MAG: rRNA pseudouridine synthase [Gammaproteobacteria bacterium]|nr:rRNA pseudouridine synthase [Gammaproteobacteria bacterium]MBT8150612.1 rRNA pseudouridine synthase [Gammaproteobacteria bacterium]NND39424.1 rRNA pseudouridine synthase [Pseudomonadales bacterium]NNM10750.1 rRNA pseudouridine synthase [Pseudomonadales bacterium]RZV57430.1 MAG: rRNA pseudouridine synthase [Pseudomonadales bacterium]